MIAGVNVVPLDREIVFADQDVLIVDGVIRDIGPAGTVEVPPGAQVIEAAGKYLMPGLVDAHVHVEREDELLMYLANGVTTVLNLHGEPVHLEWREEIEAGERFGPRLLTCGPPLRGPEETPEETAERVREIALAGYDCVKIRGEWDEGSYRAVSTATAAADLLFMGHAPRDQPVQLILSEASQRIVHLEELVYTTPALDSWIRGDEAAWDLAEVEDDVRALTAAVGEADLWIVATQIVIDNYLDRSSEEGRASLAARPFLRYLDPVNRRAWAAASVGNRERFERQTALQHRLLAALQEEGVRMALGTDASVFDNLNVMPGWSVHEELAILESVGLTPYEALRQGTSRAAEFLALDGEGSVRVGARADLLLLDGNPLEDLDHVRTPAAVFARGEWWSRAELDRRLAALETSFADLESELAQLDRAWAEGLPAVAAAYRAMGETASPELTRYLERAINRRGYALLADGEVTRAIEAFEINTELFPGSANTYDSLAEAYLESGDRERAIALYRRALEVDPEFANAARMLEEMGE